MSCKNNQTLQKGFLLQMKSNSHQTNRGKGSERWGYFTPSYQVKLITGSFPMIQ